DLQLGHTVAGGHAQALADVDIGEGDLSGDVVDDRARHVEIRRRLDALQPRRGVDLHDQGTFVAFEHVDAGDAQSHDLSRAHGGLLVHRVEGDRLHATAAVHVGAELVAVSDPTHRGDHPVPDDQSAD